MKREWGMNQNGAEAPSFLFHYFRLGDDDVLFGYVLVEAAAAGLYLGDGIDHFLAFDYLAEHAVAPAVLTGIVEEAVVLHVDEELCSGGMRIAGARHGDGVGVILQAIR